MYDNYNPRALLSKTMELKWCLFNRLLFVTIPYFIFTFRYIFYVAYTIFYNFTYFLTSYIHVQRQDKKHAYNLWHMWPSFSASLSSTKLLGFRVHWLIGYMYFPAYQWNVQSPCWLPISINMSNLALCSDHFTMTSYTWSSELWEVHLKCVFVSRQYDQVQVSQ